MAVTAVAPARTYRKEDWTDFTHTGPDTLAGRYMWRFWQPIYLGRDLKTGRAVPLTVMSEQFTLYRGEAGEPHLLAFRCAHRGTQLSTGWVEGDNLRCFYHGWVYDGSGQCVEQPAEPEPFCQRIRIGSYPVREYLGVIFGFFGEGDPPPMWSFPEFEGAGELTVARQIWPCNFFQRVENSLDHAHGAFVHRQRTNDYGLGEVPKVLGYEAEYGIKTIGLRTGHLRMQHFHMPNMNYRTSWTAPNADDLPETAPDPEGGAAASLVWRVPGDDYSTVSYLVDYLNPEDLEREMARRKARSGKRDYKGFKDQFDAADAVLRGEVAIEDLRGLSGMTNTEDYVSQVGQGDIVDRTADHLGRSDVLVILLRQLWERELRALAEGKPLTNWHRPASGYELGRILADGEEVEPELLAPVSRAMLAPYPSLAP